MYLSLDRALFLLSTSLLLPVLAVLTLLTGWSILLIGGFVQEWFTRRKLNRWLRPRLTNASGGAARAALLSDFDATGFDDPDGGAPASYTGAPNTYYEASLNAKITPFPNNDVLSNLNFRPEVRYDYADHTTWDLGRERNQLTVAVEGYFTF